ncbi:MAG: iron chelate uptake ABC transporter family permease subunit [Verrucomicrobiae bacterium]|nr:iron chelate uptake ABC transporter family permease subunit [Verrucomicrobiae bacterium]
MPDPILTARDLRFGYAANGPLGFALHLDAIEIRPGEIHALIGPNGCGKSTTLRLLAGILPPRRGEIFLAGRPLARRPRREIARDLAFLPQQVAPLFPATVFEIVLLGRHARQSGLGLATSEDQKAAARALRSFGLEAHAARSFDSLSGGERQKALLAAALAQEARVVLLDEPTTALDLHHQAELLRVLRARAAEGTAFLLATHDLTLAAQFADRTTLLVGGRREATGAPREILTESRLKAAYGEPLRTLSDPASGSPIVLPHVGPRKAACPPAPSEDRDLKTRLSQWAVGHGSSAAQDPPLTPRRFAALLASFALAALLACAIAPFFGSEPISAGHALREMAALDPSRWTLDTQILALRIPRVAMAALAGMALACVGAAFQSVLRNPLAEPYTLGIAGAAALGAVIPISLPAIAFSFGPFSGVQIWALALALGSVVLLARLCRLGWIGRSVTGLLLAGITLGLTSSALILLVRFAASPLTVSALDRWMMGGIEVTGWRDAASALPFVLAGIAALLLRARDLNQLEFGEETALGRGVDAARAQRWVLVGGSLATAGVVSVTGPIGFVGLLVPHLVRRLVGGDLRLVLPCALFSGAALLVAADTAARAISVAGRGAELPVGILTSLIGGPLFLALLMRKKW